MHVSDSGLAFIRKFEGFRANSYLDAAGLRTIGYGHLIRPGELIEEPVSADRALAILCSDVVIAERAVNRFVSVPLNQAQFNALVSFTFNLGSAVLQRSTLRRKLNRGEYDEVPVQLMRYVWTGGRKLNGLIRRRQAEAALFRS